MIKVTQHVGCFGTSIAVDQIGVRRNDRFIVRGELIIVMKVCGKVLTVARNVMWFGQKGVNIRKGTVLDIFAPMRLTG